MSIGENLVMLGVLAAVGIIILKQFLSILEDYAGLIVLLVGITMMFAPEFVAMYHWVVGMFLVIVGVALAS